MYVADFRYPAAVKRVAQMKTRAPVALCLLMLLFFASLVRYMPTSPSSAHENVATGFIVVLLIGLIPASIATLGAYLALRPYLKSGVVLRIDNVTRWDYMKQIKELDGYWDENDLFKWQQDAEYRKQIERLKSRNSKVQS